MIGLQSTGEIVVVISMKVPKMFVIISRVTGVFRAIVEGIFVDVVTITITITTQMCLLCQSLKLLGNDS